MSAFQGAANTTIHGGNFTTVLNTVTITDTQNDIISVFLSRSATAGLLDAAERFDAPKCDFGTRMSMLHGMKQFVQKGGRSSVFWLHGPAGVGKSALAQSLALSLKDQGDHAASFFFSRTAPGRNDGNKLIVTLACQLALNIPAIKPLLAKAVKENPLVLNATNAVKMQSLIVDPINQLHRISRWNPQMWAQRVVKRKLHPRLILVDGLDECHDPQVQRDLILCIGQAVRQLSLPFRFVITSRPESHILATFELDPIFQGPHGVNVSTKNLGDDDDADEQITTFLLKEFSEIRRAHPIREFLPQPWPLPGQIAQLVSKSSKGFIYPATVVRYIRMPNNRPDECLERILGLSEIPIFDKPYEPLDTLYRYIFESVPDANKKAVRNIFHFLVVPNDLDDLITPRLIEKYFDYKPGHVQHVLRDLCCLVAFTRGNTTIKILHASLPDFLLDRSRSGSLCIDVGDAHAAIAASLPLALSSIHTSRLPDFAFVEFLQHMMLANMSNPLVHNILVDVDFRSRYRELSGIRLGNRVEQVRSLDELDFEGIAVVVAYLLVLVIKNVEQTNIRRHITGIKAYILQKSPFAASINAVRDELFPEMIPLFRRWASSTIEHEYINYIFAFKVISSQSEIRDEIFQLYLLMIIPIFGRTTVDEHHSQTIRHQPRTDQLTNYSNTISNALLEILLCDSTSFPPVKRLQHLVADLLGVSLAHASYSASLTTLLYKLLDARRALERYWRECVCILTPSVTEYVERVYLEPPPGARLEILELNDAWRRYLIQHKIDPQPESLDDA